MRDRHDAWVKAAKKQGFHVRQEADAAYIDVPGEANDRKALLKLLLKRQPCKMDVTDGVLKVW